MAENFVKGDSVDVAYAPVITEQSFEPGDQELREELPKTGVFEVLHDFQPFGFEAEDKANGGWAVR